MYLTKDLFYALGLNHLFEYLYLGDDCEGDNWIPVHLIGGKCTNIIVNGDAFNIGTDGSSSSGGDPN